MEQKKRAGVLQWHPAWNGIAEKYAPEYNVDEIYNEWKLKIRKEQ